MHDSQPEEIQHASLRRNHNQLSDWIVIVPDTFDVRVPQLDLPLHLPPPRISVKNRPISSAISRGWV
jgi:hypothetical protein